MPRPGVILFLIGVGYLCTSAVAPVSVLVAGAMIVLVLALIK